jgi:hypothetical protein
MAELDSGITSVGKGISSFSETKVCYLDYSGTFQRAQIDNYE